MASSAQSKDIDRRVPNVIAWCDEHCNKDHRTDTLQALSDLAAAYGMTVMAFQKAYKYSEWLRRACEEHPGGTPHILVTDWREFKPCNIFLQKVTTEEASPSTFVLWLDGWNKHTSAAKAIVETSSTSSCSDFRLVHNWTELSLLVHQVYSPMSATYAPNCAPLQQPYRQQRQPQQYQQQQQWRQQRQPQQYQHHYHQPQATQPGVPMAKPTSPQLFAGVATTAAPGAGSPSNNWPGSDTSPAAQTFFPSPAACPRHFPYPSQSYNEQRPRIAAASADQVRMPWTTAEHLELYFSRASSKRSTTTTMTMTTLNSDSRQPETRSASTSEDGNDMQQSSSNSELDAGSSLSRADACQGPENVANVGTFWKGLQDKGAPHVSEFVRLCFPAASCAEVAAALQAAAAETSCYHD